MCCVFPREARRTRGKIKLTGFLCVLTLSISLYFKTFTSKVTNNRQRIKTMSHKFSCRDCQIKNSKYIKKKIDSLDFKFLNFLTNPKDKTNSYEVINMYPNIYPCVKVYRFPAVLFETLKTESIFPPPVTSFTAML